MEQFDILDKSGNPTGFTAGKGTCLHAGQYYLGTHAYIFNMSMEFLIQQRALSKEFLPGGWDVHLEHAIAGETSVECVIRGLKEEIGLIVTEANICSSDRFVWEDYNHIIDVYFIQTSFGIDELILHREEVIDVKFISLDEMRVLVSNINYRPREYAQLVLSQIKCLTS